MSKTGADKQIDQIKRLLEELRELQAKTYAIAEEMQRIVNGGPGIGDLLKRLYASYDLAWCNRYTPGLNGRYMWNYKTDAPNAKRLILRLGIEEVESRADRFIKNDDPFYAKARHPFLMFVSSINSHASVGQPTGARAVGCSCTPPCRTDAEHTIRRRAQA